VGALVNARFMEDVYAQLERLEQKQAAAAAEVCTEHHAALHYFCSTCNESICADCAMFTNKVGANVVPSCALARPAAASSAL
jgi:adenosyl cobinamide kinase/adenosyl cobinamide phosphate guanylyltransferase